MTKNAFCVNLDEVWPLAFERKDHAVRVLTKDYFEGVDYTIKTDDTFPLNGELEKSISYRWMESSRRLLPYRLVHRTSLTLFNAKLLVYLGDYA